MKDRELYYAGLNYELSIIWRIFDMKKVHKVISGYLGTIWIYPLAGLFCNI